MPQTIFEPGSTLEWRQPGPAKEGFVLTAGDKEIARFWVKGWKVSSSHGECSLGRWVFRKEGFWNPHYLIREENTEIDVAEFFPKWHRSGGRIQFANGKEFSWKPEGTFARVYVISDPAGAPVLRLRPGGKGSFWKRLFKEEGELEIGTVSVDPKTLHVLMMFIWHLVLMLKQQRAAATS